MDITKTHLKVQGFILASMLGLPMGTAFLLWLADGEQRGSFASSNIVQVRYIAATLVMNKTDLLGHKELARLERMGYVDDRAFALYWIENRERFRPRGPRALRYELRQKGIPESMINEVLDGLDPASSARQAAEDKARRLRGLAPEAFRERLGAFLVRRGFEYDVVREVVDQLLAERPDNFESEQTNEE